MSLGKCRQLCNHHCIKVLKHFHHLKTIFPALSLDPDNHWSAFCCYCFAFFGNSCWRNYWVCSLFCLASFLQHDVFWDSSMLLSVSVIYSFLLLSSIPLCDYKIVYPFMCWWSSSFCEHSFKCLWAYVLFLLGKSLGEDFLGHTVFIRNCQPFDKVIYHFILQAATYDSSCTTPLQDLVLLVCIILATKWKLTVVLIIYISLMTNNFEHLSHVFVGYWYTFFCEISVQVFFSFFDWAIFSSLYWLVRVIYELYIQAFHRMYKL